MARWLTWVAEAEEEICGHAFVRPVERMPEPCEDNNPIGHVTNFFVLPSQRNEGTGSALLEALKEHARGAGLEGLMVRPSERSTPLCQRLGFHSPEEPPSTGPVELVSPGAPRRHPPWGRHSRERRQGARLPALHPPSRVAC
ncbi:GNAT family N-acetyltransferase [Streptomyces sp. NPDC055005]